MYRFYINSTIVSPQFTSFDQQLIHQLVNVLRFKPNQELILFDNNHLEYLVKLVEYNKKNITFTIEKKLTNNCEPELQISLYQAIIKRDNFEWVLQKGTELGASSFIPLLTSHCEKKNIKQERCKKILQEATEQSGRVCIPKLEPITNFTTAINNAPKPIIFFSITGQDLKLDHNLKQASVFIGPEGDWSQEELAAAKAAGAIFYNLGTRILRSETAALAALSKILI